MVGSTLASERSVALEEGFAWRVVLACFCVAVMGWGFGFYGQAVYLAELQRMNGWSALLISSATTTYYLFGALLLTFAHDAISRAGPRWVLFGAAVLMALAAVGASLAAAPWQLYAASLLMAFGWAGTSSTAITTTVALWFDRKRGLAISLALNGASVAGFTVAPALVYLSSRYGLPASVIGVAGGMVVLLCPIVLLGLRGPPAITAVPASGPLPMAGLPRRREVLAGWRFWSIAAPFAVGLAAQVGYLTHQVAFLLPALKTELTGIAVAIGSIAAVSGRLGLGLVIDRLNQRRVTALCFVSQAMALGAMALWPHQVPVLLAGTVVFGLSVGNVITLPALIVQREFGARAFGLVIGLSTAVGQVTYAFGPAAVGLVRDAAGRYGPGLGLCILLEVIAGLIVLRRPRAGLPA